MARRYRSNERDRQAGPAPSPAAGHQPFHAVNRPGRSGSCADLQRHHLLPRELLAKPSCATLFAALDPRAVGIDDFRRNGVLLLATFEAACRSGLPLHRGPHRIYTDMVRDRIGTIEQAWSHGRKTAPTAASCDALFRLALVQRALRRSLLGASAHRLPLSRRDPALCPGLFTDLDAMAEQLWGAAQWDSEE